MVAAILPKSMNEWSDKIRKFLVSSDGKTTDEWWNGEPNYIKFISLLWLAWFMTLINNFINFNY